jgi:ABC-type amino acid transport substrate-binding protein
MDDLRKEGCMSRRSAPWLLGVLVFASAAVVGGTMLSAQDDSVYARVMKDKKLRIFAVQFPPQIFQDTPEAEWTGFDADIYRYIAKRLGVQAEFVPTAAAAMIPMLTSGRADMGLAMYRTPEREKVVDFTAPYKWVSDHVIVHADDKELTSLPALKGRTLGVVRGTIHEMAARKIHEDGYAKDVRVFDSLDAMYRDLSVKRIDAIMYQSLYHEWIITQKPEYRARLGFEVDPRFFGRTGRSPSQFPVAKGANKLIETVNAVIIEMRENGEMGRIFGKYGIMEPTVWTPPQ